MALITGNDIMLFNGANVAELSSYLRATSRSGLLHNCPALRWTNFGTFHERKS